jgi:hypothetical protein
MSNTRHQYTKEFTKEAVTLTYGPDATIAQVARIWVLMLRCWAADVGSLRLYSSLEDEETVFALRF